ncbi:MAG: questin oxidase family protein [Acidimicrobiaceae bacterium]|nr:questin oxidase family protein [Acidimicrobiaceae bacterium]
MVQGSATILQQLLGEELTSDPTTLRGLTNHLPMALVAKQRLGADGEELQRFAALYSRRLAPLAKSKDHLDRSTWQGAIGHPGSGPELRAYFARCVAEDGFDATLRSHLPTLLPGVGGAGFHGVIRLAYAIEASSPLQIAAGLAYFAQVAKPLAALEATGATSPDPMGLFAALAKSREWSAPQRARRIDEEMRIVAEREGFARAAASLVVDEHSEERLAKCALRMFASSDDFTALHGVTGLAALAVLRPWLENQESIDRYAFQALLAAYLSIGAPLIWSQDRLDEFVATTNVELGEVRRGAANSDDEHVAKLTYSALGGFETTAEPIYLAVAARAVASDSSIQ